MKHQLTDALAATASVALVLLPTAAWITHCVWWVGLMVDGSMEVWQGVLAILGTVAFPIGVIHGFVLWFS